MKKLLALLLSFMCASLIFAASNSFIKILSPSDGDSNYLYNTEEPVADEHIVFKGEVSPDCVSIRVIWSPKTFDNITNYLLNKKKLAGDVIDDFTLKAFKAGDKNFQYNVNGTLDNLQWGTNCYLFIAKFSDGTYKTCNIKYYVYQGGGYERGKPVIYLYPKKTQNVKVSVAPAGGVTVSIPEMGKQWKVKATPEGKITDLKTKQEYPYLFWESADQNVEIDMTKGFVTPVAELNEFFGEKLTALGLNEKEIADFCEYWIPSIEKEGKPFVFINFYSMERIDREAPLSVSPAPDSVIRVYFDHKSLEAPIEVEPQELSAPERKGFAVVEWGGRLYK